MSRYWINFDNLFIHYLLENQKLYTNQAFRNPEIFERKKILVRQILWKSIYATFDNENYYVDQKIYVIYSNKQLKNKYLLSILSSKLMYFFYQNIYWDNKIVFPQIKRSQMLELPIKNISPEEQLPFIEKADFMLQKNKELQEKINKFLKRLNSSFEIEKLPNKLKTFYTLDFPDFVKELKKKKITLTLKDQDEWEEYFDSYKKEILELKSEIDNCDLEIDEMVFELYWLSEEEKGIVRGE